MWAQLSRFKVKPTLRVSICLYQVCHVPRIIKDVVSLRQTSVQHHPHASSLTDIYLHWYLFTLLLNILWVVRSTGNRMCLPFHRNLVSPLFFSDQCIEFPSLFCLLRTMESVSTVSIVGRWRCEFISVSTAATKSAPAPIHQLHRLNTEHTGFHPLRRRRS